MEDLLNKIIDEISNKIAIEVIQHLQQMDSSITKEYLPVMTRKQLAEYLQVSIAWVDKNINSIPHLKGIGGTRFRKTDINEWLNSKLESPQYTTSNITTKSYKSSTFKVK
nr:helix-turn-helix domain-containing protein [uncultured Cellulosilyticum sp.]